MELSSGSGPHAPALTIMVWKAQQFNNPKYFSRPAITILNKIRDFNKTYSPCKIDNTVLSDPAIMFNARTDKYSSTNCHIYYVTLNFLI